LAACFLVVLVLFALEFKAWAIVPAVFALSIGFFFRDPERTVPGGAGVVVSPADGKVIAIESGVESDLLSGKLKSVSVFMSPLDVHVNRSPISGRVVEVRRKGGKFLPAFRKEATRENEQNAILVEDEQGRRVLFVQVAGALARRIICRVEKGNRLLQGERVGMIVLGSRLDLYLSHSFQLNVALGDRVRAGETVIGRYP
jgi:phosphatidylserine decarboxylase